MKKAKPSARTVLYTSLLLSAAYWQSRLHRCSAGRTTAAVIKTVVRCIRLKHVRADRVSARFSRNVVRIAAINPESANADAVLGQQHRDRVLTTLTGRQNIPFGHKKGAVSC